MTGKIVLEYPRISNFNRPIGLSGDLWRRRIPSPMLQRFISEDPLGFAGGDANLYAYVKNNPVNSFDPLGLDPPQDPLGHDGPVHPLELTPGEIAGGEVVKIPAEAVGS